MILQKTKKYISDCSSRHRAFNFSCFFKIHDTKIDHFPLQSISWLYDTKINESSRNPWSDSRYKVFLVNTICCQKLFDAKKRSKEQTERGSNLFSKVLAEKVTKNYSSKNYTKHYFNYKQKVCKTLI